MKKSTFMNLALSIVAIFMSLGVMAQDLPANYALISADAVTANTSYVTEGATIPFYVTPDNRYHPTWAAFSTGLTAGFTWNFYDDGSWANGTELSLAVTANKVLITANTIGSYPINVKEQAPPAWGGCEDPTGVDFTVIVLPVPTATISGSGLVADWNILTPSYAFAGCGDKVAETLTLTIPEAGVPAALQLYAYAVQKRTVILRADGSEEFVVSTTYPIDHTIAAKGYTTSVTTGALNVLTYDWDGAGPGAAADSRTMYEYSLVKATDAPVAMAQGIISAVSQKSDYLTITVPATATDYTSYAFTGTTLVSYIVNPAPITGPVYHISNSYGI